jgi:hypothetical protein
MISLTMAANLPVRSGMRRSANVAPSVRILAEEPWAFVRGEALDFDAFGSAAHDGALHRRRGRGGAEEEHGKREGQNARHVF